MRSATAASAVQSERARVMPEPRVRLESGNEEVLLHLDLSDLVLPKVNDLHVDGLKSSWLSRLFGKR